MGRLKHSRRTRLYSLGSPFEWPQGWNRGLSGDCDTGVDGEIHTC
jgi:hypothetical protein